MKKKNITIKDVASAAGVSKTTISRYLNGRYELMGPKTKERIEKVIKLLDFHPSELARSLKSKKTNTIGVVVSEIQSPFFAATIKGIEDVLFDNGYSAIFMDCGNNYEKEEKYIQEMLMRDVEGLIINTTRMDNDYLVSLDVQKIPIVLCDRYIKNHKFDIVSIDNENMMKQIFDHLEKQGFNRFAFFSEPWSQNSSRTNRRKFFLNEIKQRFGYDASRDTYEIGTSYKDCDEALECFAKTFGKNDIPVIIGVNTVVTFAAYRAILKKGLKVPKDIGIVGPDDWNWDGSMSWPDVTATSVTTTLFDSRNLGANCAKLLLNKINNPDKKIEEIKLNTSLIIRNSTTRKEN